jgi:hypothetical protein
MPSGISNNMQEQEAGRSQMNMQMSSQVTQLRVQQMESGSSQSSSVL